MTPISNLIVYGGIVGGVGNQKCDTEEERNVFSNNCPVTWTKAREFCESVGGFLALPRTAQEVAALQAWIDSAAAGSPKQAWIGLNDRETNTRWGGYWGDPDDATNPAPFLTFPNKNRDDLTVFDVQYHNWPGPSVPTHSSSSEKNCAIQQGTNSGSQWLTKNCGQNHAYACYGVSPQPATAALEYVFLPSPSPPPSRRRRRRRRRRPHRRAHRRLRRRRRRRRLPRRPRRRHHRRPRRRRRRRHRFRRSSTTTASTGRMTCR